MRKPSSYGVAKLLCISFLLTWQVTSALAQPAPIWTGSVTCQLNDQEQGAYQRQEIQTWTLTGAPRDPSQGMPVYPATWTAQAQGQLLRQQGTQATSIQWMANVPAQGSQPPMVGLAITVRASDGRLLIKQWTVAQSAANAVSGRRQLFVNGVPQGQPVTFSRALQQWQFPLIEANPTDDPVTGSTQIQADAGSAELVHRYGGGLPSATCQWRFTKGGSGAQNSGPVGTMGSGSTNQNPQNSNGNSGAQNNNPTGMGGGAQNSNQQSPQTTTPTSPASNPNCDSPAAVQQSFEAMKVNIKSSYDTLIQGTTDQAQIASLTQQEQRTLASLSNQEQHDMQKAAADGCTGAGQAGSPQNSTNPNSSAPTGSSQTGSGPSGGQTGSSTTPAPAIAQISPDHVQEAQNQAMPSNFPVTITGNNTHFNQATTKVDFGLQYVSVASVTVNSPTSLIAYLNFTQAPFNGADHYPCLITVTTGSESVHLDGGFSVYVPAQSNPIAQLSPNSGEQGQAVSVTLTGQFTHFATGSTVMLVTNNSLSPSRVTVNSPTSATLSFSIFPWAGPGSTRIGLMTQTSNGPEQVFGTFTINRMGLDSYDHIGSNPTDINISSTHLTQTLDGQLPLGAYDFFELDCNTSTCVVSLPNLNPELYPPPGSSMPWGVVADVMSDISQPPTTTVGGPQNPALQTTLQFGYYIVRVHIGQNGTSSKYRLVVTGSSSGSNSSGSGSNSSAGSNTGLKLGTPNQVKVLSMLTGVSPTTNSGQSNVTVTLTGQGTHFATGSTKVSFARSATQGSSISAMPNNAALQALAGSASPPALQAGQVQAATATSLAVPVSMNPATAAGSYDITVTTPIPGGTETVTLKNVFTVTNAPSLTGVNISPPVVSKNIGSSTPPAPASAKYRAVITGLMCMQHISSDDAIYAAAVVRQYDRRNNQNTMFTNLNTWVYGDVNGLQGQRKQAGSRGPGGGIGDGDLVPTGFTPGIRDTLPTPQVNNLLPLTLWEGTLTDGVDALVISPSLWINYGDNPFFSTWNQNEDSFTNSIFTDSRVQNQINTQTLGPLVLGSSQTVGGSFAQSYAGDVAQAVIDTVLVIPFVELQGNPSHDRPIGVVDAAKDATASMVLPNTTLVLTREMIEKSLGSGSWMMMPLIFNDTAHGFTNLIGSDRPGQYQMFIQIERQ